MQVILDMENMLIVAIGFIWRDRSIQTLLLATSYVNMW